MFTFFYFIYFVVFNVHMCFGVLVSFVGGNLISTGMASGRPADLYVFQCVVVFVVTSVITIIVPTAGVVPVVGWSWW